MYGKEFIMIATKLYGYSQKQLAELMNVSPAQVSKWRKGENISNEKEKKLRSILKLGERHPPMVYYVGGIKQYDQWYDFLKYIVEIEGYETDYICDQLIDNFDLTIEVIFQELIEAGLEIPQSFPIQSESIDWRNTENFETIKEYPF